MADDSTLRFCLKDLATVLMLTYISKLQYNTRYLLFLFCLRLAENFPKEKIGLLLRKLVRECLKEFPWNSAEWEKIEEVKRLTLPGGVSGLRLV